MITRIAAISGAVGAVLLPTAAEAYIGPGAGASLAGSLLAVLAAIATALAIVLFWPLRLLYRKIKGGKPAAAGSVAQTESAEDAPSPGTAE
jgi:O-antigen/teichoic acid export membrane protein